MLKINETVFNGLLVLAVTVVAVLVIGLAFGFVPAENQETVWNMITGAAGAFVGLVLNKKEG